MTDAENLREEAREALTRFWFIKSVEEIERTDITLSLRLYIHPMLFVNVFWGERSGSLFFALIEMGRRIYGIDLENGVWHMHPLEATERQVQLEAGLEPKPLLRFLSRVESLLIEQDLL